MPGAMFTHGIFVFFIFYLDFKVSHAGYLEDVCMQPSDEGHKCSDGSSHTSGTFYYFSAQQEECLPFPYKGCGGNQNRFAIQDECTDACQVDWFLKKNKKSRKKGPSGIETDTDVPVDCSAAPKSGPCRALISQWYYDGESKKCRQFNYGGCKGNGNRFSSEEQCEEACAPK